MEAKRGGQVLLLSHNGKQACNQCYTAHQRCSRRFPVCDRCASNGLGCTWVLDRRKYALDKLVRERRMGAKELAVSTWRDAIDAYPVVSLRRFQVRRFVIPLVLAVPAPAVAKRIMDVCLDHLPATFLALEKRVLLQVEYPAAQLHHTLETATRTFFRLFNPFCPLFSEEAFHSRPRSSTLRKVVIQVGLEHMPQTDLTQAAERENGFDPAALLHMPYTLDTLQCILLALYGTRRPKNAMLRPTVLLLNRLPSFLGLHVETRPSWLERTLAMHFVHLGIYNFSIAQNTSTAQIVELERKPRHLNPSFLPRMANHFPHLSDRIHFIASQTMFHSFVIVNSLAKERMRALKEKTPAAAFASSLDKHAVLLRENLLWGWAHLSHLARDPSPHTSLIFQSRLTLAIRHCNSYVELMKMASHIPLNPANPLSPEPRIRATTHAQQGLNMAVRCVRLLATVTPIPLGMDCVLAIVPSVAFMLLYAKVLKPNFPFQQRVQAALRDAREFLARAQAVAYLAPCARTYAELVELVTQE